jgi:predicted O-methyltransferase YrrM
MQEHLLGEIILSSHPVLLDEKVISKISCSENHGLDMIFIDCNKANIIQEPLPGVWILAIRVLENVVHHEVQDDMMHIGSPQA